MLHHCKTSAPIPVFPLYSLSTSLCTWNGLLWEFSLKKLKKNNQKRRTRYYLPHSFISSFYCIQNMYCRQRTLRFRRKWKIDRKKAVLQAVSMHTTNFTLSICTNGRLSGLMISTLEPRSKGLGLRQDTLL